MASTLACTSRSTRSSPTSCGTTTRRRPGRPPSGSVTPVGTVTRSSMSSAASPSPTCTAPSPEGRQSIPRPTAGRWRRSAGGRRGGPPEDCGGVWGYAELLDLLADPDHPEHAERLDWLGHEPDPAAFDKDAINRALSEIPVP